MRPLRRGGEPCTVYLGRDRLIGVPSTGGDSNVVWQITTVFFTARLHRRRDQHTNHDAQSNPRARRKRRHLSPMSTGTTFNFRCSSSLRRHTRTERQRATHSPDGPAIVDEVGLLRPLGQVAEASSTNGGLRWDGSFRSDFAPSLGDLSTRALRPFATFGIGQT
jgi:hypothetical protein